MKRLLSLLLATLMLMCIFTGCLNSAANQEKTDTANLETNDDTPKTDDAADNGGSNETDAPSDSSEDTGSNTEPELGDDDDSFGDDLTDTDIYDGYFEDAKQNINIECVSGTQNAYTISKNTLTFTGISEDSVFSISGQFNGNIVIDVGDDFKFELELKGFSLICTDTNPVSVLSGDKVTLTAKKESENYIYDKREAVVESDESLKKGAIHSEVDLQIGGKGTLTIVSDNNNGIHSKDDLEVKNLTLTVTCKDNALKGNDSVEMTDGTLVLIATQGDGIKTSNSDVSAKGNQRGIVSINGTKLTVYAACDGIDAAYDVIIDGETTTVNIYTDKYSNYSEEITATSSSDYYIRFTSKSYQYSVKYYNSETDYEWVNASYHSAVLAGKTSYYYYSFPKKAEYDKIQIFIYSSDMEQGQETDYEAKTDYMTPSTSYDTIAITNRGYSWTNYTTTISGGGFGGGFGGGMNDGNTEKGDHSTKGIKAANEIIINNGCINIKSYDDALHADNSTTLENGEAALGNISVNGGNVTLYSNDDGIHAENIVYINGGNVDIENSYEGVEGLQIFISAGNVSIYAKDDGMNSTASSGTGVTLSGGYLYIYCTGDGIDSNSRTSYSGICFEGGDAVIISNSGMNSAIDTEQGYSYTAGSIVAIMPSGGMSNEARHCQNFSSVGTSKNMKLSSGSVLTVSGDMNKSITMPCSISNAYVIILNNNTSVTN